MTRQKIIYDFLLFQVAWFACVLSTLSPFPVLLPIIGLIPVVIRSVFIHGVFRLLPFAFACLILGLIGDACLVHFQLITFRPSASLLGVPFWMLLLWLNFALMLHPLFDWFLKGRWRCLLGFSLGGALAYYSGHKFEVLTFQQGWYTALAVAAEWAVVSFVLRHLYFKFHNKQNS